VVVEGLTYPEDFVSPAEERELLELIEPLDFRQIVVRCVLSGKARWSWPHSIPPAKALRYSVTFRTLKRSG
jgi:hypothetical protein